MWKAAVGHSVSVKVEVEGDDWDTDPDFVNDITEKEQRWGAKTIEGSGRPEHIDIHHLRSKVSEEHQVLKKKELEMGPKASYGYGGKFGTERDRMDKSALGHEYVAEVGMHSSQTDAAKGFGGKYGVQKDRADKSAQGFDYKGEVEKHPSQKDYAVGFGGKFGVQKDHQDKSALSWAHKEEVPCHESQTDYAKGFGGRFGVQKDRMDKSAVGFNEMEAATSSYEKTMPVEAASGGAGSLKQRFENMAKAAEEESRKRAEEERQRRQAREQREQRAAQEQQVAQKSKEPVYKSPGKEPSPGPLQVCQEAIWPPVSAAHQGAAEKGEEQAPALPPRHQDLEEDAQDLLPKAPPLQDLLYGENADEGGQDYEDVPAPPGCWEEPPGLKEEDGGEGDYEEMPGPLGNAEPIYDDSSADTAQDYEDIPEWKPGGSGVAPSGGSEGPVYKIGDPGLSAVALYDYQGDGDDEISFDPGDTITHIEQVDEGWWRGRCRGAVGLFPANYVELLQ